jgi:hypothetical protein
VARFRGELGRRGEVADHCAVSDQVLDLLDPERDLPADSLVACLKPPPLVELAAQGRDDPGVRLGHAGMMTGS